MTTGTKVFLAVFALIVGILVVYYGMIVPGNTTRTAGGPDKIASPSPERSGSDAPSPGDRAANPDWRPPPAARNPAPSSPPAPSMPSHITSGDGFLTETIREASLANGEAVGAAAGMRDRQVAPGGDRKPAAPATPYLPLVGLNAGDFTNSNAATPMADAPDDDQPAPTTQPRPAEPPAAPAAAAPAAAPSDAPAPSVKRIEFTIAEGDTFVSIAEAWFGDSAKWSLIAKENPTVDPQRLKIGQKIFLPPREAGVAPVKPGPILETGQTLHVIQSGDTLIDIARETLGDGARWEEIYVLNREAIGPDPAALKVGMKIKLPKK